MVDKHTKSKAYGATETLEELVDALNTRVELSDAPLNIPGYCACSYADLEDVSAYVAQELAISPEDIYHIALNPATKPMYKLYDLLKDVHYNNLSSSTKLVLATGIEQFNIVSFHGYDQSMVQTIGEQLERNPPQIPKKIVVITNISPSHGQEKYHGLKEDARRISQFKQFYWEF